jgi:predicted flap endonuclease-1-like 5' DNA nuclease
VERIFQAILWGFQKTKLITSLSLEVLPHADYQKEGILWNWPESLAHFFPFEGSHMANYPVQDVEGIGPVRGEALRNAGINDTDKLLAATKTAKQRQELAAKTGISDAHILKFANMVDLYRIQGIGSEYSELLESSGVDTVVELSKRVPENLHATLEKVNTEKSKTRRTPTQVEVTQWVAQAKTLPRVLEY